MILNDTILSQIDDFITRAWKSEKYGSFNESYIIDIPILTKKIDETNFDKHSLIYYYIITTDNDNVGFIVSLIDNNIDEYKLLSIEFDIFIKNTIKNIENELKEDNIKKIQIFTEGKYLERYLEIFTEKEENFIVKINEKRDDKEIEYFINDKKRKISEMNLTLRGGLKN